MDSQESRGFWDSMEIMKIKLCTINFIFLSAVRLFWAQSYKSFRSLFRRLAQSS